MAAAAASRLARLCPEAPPSFDGDNSWRLPHPVPELPEATAHRQAYFELIKVAGRNIPVCVCLPFPFFFFWVPRRKRLRRAGGPDRPRGPPFACAQAHAGAVHGGDLCPPVLHEAFLQGGGAPPHGAAAFFGRGGRHRRRPHEEETCGRSPGPPQPPLPSIPPCASRDDRAISLTHSLAHSMRRRSSTPPAFSWRPKWKRPRDAWTCARARARARACCALRRRPLSRES